VKNKVLWVVIMTFALLFATACTAQDYTATETGEDVEIAIDTNSETIEEPDEIVEEPIDQLAFESLNHFRVNSQNLNPSTGVWDTIITNTKNGENHSPSLSWDPVDGANYYAVYMIDGTWLHMEFYTDKTEFSENEIAETENAKYVGPYPPSGTHTYDVYVVALKELPQSIKTYFDGSGNYIDDFTHDLDVDMNANSGNIIAGGKLSGTYTYGD